MKIYILRTTRAKKTVWIVFNETNILYGKPKDSKQVVIDKWREQFGTIQKVVTYKGLMRPSEAAMTISDIQH